MSRDPVLKAESLRKKYGRREVLKGIGFELHSGEILGFLGANGAGKSTTIRILLSLVFPDQGGFRILDQSFPGGSRKVYGRVGALVERADLYSHLSAMENLRILGGMQGITETAKMRQVLERVGLDERRNERVSSFSHGMKQRLGLAQAILHEPELLILDEPATGLDPAGMREVRELIGALAREQGMAVLFSSHLLGEVEQLADRVLIIDEGSPVAEGRLADLFAQLPERMLEIRCDDLLGARHFLAQIEGITILSTQSQHILLKLKQGIAPAVTQLCEDLQKQQLGLSEFHYADSLEDLFLNHLAGMESNHA